MHLAEGVLPLSQAIAWSALAGPTVFWSLRGEQRTRRNTPSSSVIMAGATSLLFAGTLLPLPVPVVGATSHICLTPVLALVVGVRRIVWPTFFVLLLQAVFFAHGGLTTLGVNILTLGLLGPLTTVGLWALLRWLGIDGTFRLALACGVGGLSVYVADAVVLAVALSDVTAPATTFGAVLLLFAHARGHRRIKPALAWILAIVALALLGGVALDSNADVIVQTSVRVLCGTIWILWLGTQVDWASLRQLLLWLRIPEGVVASLDHALMHGVLTQREWVQRRDAARLRLGSPRLPLAAWGPLLGEGALHAFARLERAEENALLRSASCEDVRAHDGIYLDAIDVERSGQLVLEQLELRLARAEWLLVCGPSGAGKSSLLRLLAGLDGPAQGTMTRLGNHVSPDATLRARLHGRVALLDQNPEHHFIASTVAEDIAWGLLRRGVEAGEARCRSREVAMALRIDHLLERPCHQLSFGEQRRVALAGLLVLEPALLLLDEPTAGLDPVAAHELRTLVVESVRRTSATCVWATHCLHSLPSQATRVVLLRDRRLLFDGSTAEGLSKPWLIRAGLAV